MVPSLTRSYWKLGLPSDGGYIRNEAASNESMDRQVDRLDRCGSVRKCNRKGGEFQTTSDVFRLFLRSSIPSMVCVDHVDSVDVRSGDAMEELLPWSQVSLGPRASTQSAGGDDVESAVKSHCTSCYARCSPDSMTYGKC